MQTHLESFCITALGKALCLKFVSIISSGVSHMSNAKSLLVQQTLEQIEQELGTGMVPRIFQLEDLQTANG